jgi:DNA-binding IclR family transcriptional regulator
VPGAVNKAFRAINLLRRTPAPMTLTEVARGVGMAPSTAHSILGELLEQGVVVQDGARRYRLGPATFYLGAAYARNVPIYRAVWRELVDLGRDTSLTTVIAVPWEGHHLILHVHSAAAGTEVAAGRRVPLAAGAWGKTYYAWSGEPLPAELPAHTARTITDVDEYAIEIDRARARGYAVDLEEFAPGAGALASAVTSDTGYEGLAALVGSVAEIEPVVEETGRRLAAVVSRASYALGAHTRVLVVGAD